MIALSASVLLLLSSACGSPAPPTDSPLVNLIKEAIYEADEYIAKNNLDVIKMFNIGFPWDPVKLRNGTFGNFSTISLIDSPVVSEKDSPDGSTLLSFDLPMTLEVIKVEYDFTVNILGLYKREGTAAISVSDASAIINGTYLMGGDGSCRVALDSVVIPSFGEFTIDIRPDDLPDLTKVNEAILNAITPLLVPEANEAIKLVIGTSLFKNKFSDMVCKLIPI